MAGNDRRAHPRYPAWFPITVRFEGRSEPLPGMLCDISNGGAMVWGFWSGCPATIVDVEIQYRSEAFLLPAHIVSTERQWDTDILHLQFPDGLVDGSPRLIELIAELRDHFEDHQVYLSHRADDDPALGRTVTQYPGDRASA